MKNQAVNDFDEALERYIPILMAQAKIFWDRENYQVSLFCAFIALEYFRNKLKWNELRSYIYAYSLKGSIVIWKA